MAPAPPASTGVCQKWSQLAGAGAIDFGPPPAWTPRSVWLATTPLVYASPGPAQAITAGSEVVDDVSALGPNSIAGPANTNATPIEMTAKIKPLILNSFLPRT